MENITTDPEELIKLLVKQLVEAGQLDELRDLINEYHPADIADVLDELPPEQALLIFEILSDDGGTSYDFYIDGELVATSSSNLPATSTSFTYGATAISITSSQREYHFKSLDMLVGNPADSLAYIDQELPSYDL